MSEDLSSFFSLIAEEKKKQKEEINSLIGEDFFDENFLNNLVEAAKPKKKVKEIIVEETEPVEEVKEDFNYIENYVSALKILDKNEKLNETLTNPSTKEIQELKNLVWQLMRDVHLHGGGGEVLLEFLDDVDRDSVKVNHKFLRYDAPTKKWIGAYAGEAPFISSTTYITSSSYTITENDYYIGVNYAGAVTITLPSVSIEGTTYIVKDELGQASKGTNRYITILPSGSDLIDGRDRAILAFDYGSLTFVYRNGWRVV